MCFFRTIFSIRYPTPTRHSTVYPNLPKILLNSKTLTRKEFNLESTKSSSPQRYSTNSEALDHQSECRIKNTNKSKSFFRKTIFSPHQNKAFSSKSIRKFSKAYSVFGLLRIIKALRKLILIRATSSAGL